MLPTVNAALNTVSAVLILSGYLLIRRKRVREHRLCMLGAVATSTVFLVSYLVYHYSRGATRFEGTGLVRGIYFLVLISHTILAAAIVPLVLVTVYRGLRSDFSRHVRVARWTFPIWLYVSVTGVVVYVMLYHL